MKKLVILAELVFLAVFASGCFDSIVSDPCAVGYQLHEGACVASSQLGSDGTIVDGGIPVTGDGSDVPPVCTADTTSDPKNCGACGIVCTSGICENSVCVGDVSGHIIAIGHDFQQHDGSMSRVIGNAVALGKHPDVGVARFRGSAKTAAVQGTTAAITESMAKIGRVWHTVELPATPGPSALEGVDVVVVDAQTGDGDHAEQVAGPWLPYFSGFIASGGVIVVLEGKNGVGYRFARGAGLYDLAPPVDATGDVATVIAPTDATALGVVSPYLAEPTSVAFPGATGATVTVDAGAVVFHLSPE